MKTLLVTAFLAVAIGACSSDNSAAPVTATSGNADGTSCTSTAQCDGTLVCAFPIAPTDAGVGPTTGPSSCNSTGTGVCVGIGPLSVLQACSCSSPTTVVSVEQLGGIYTLSQAIMCEPLEDASAGGSTTGG